MKPRKPVKLKPVVHREGFTLPEWSILSGHSRRSLLYHVKMNYWVTPNGEAGARKIGRDWVFYPSAVLKMPPHHAGPGRPKGGNKLGYPRDAARIGKIKSHVVK